MKTNLIYAGIGGAIAYAWVVSASVIYCIAIGHQEAFVFPFVQWVQVLPSWDANWFVKVCIVGSAAFPSTVMYLVAWTCWQNREKLRRQPLTGKLRPVERGVSLIHGDAHFATPAECLKRYHGPAGVVIGELITGAPGTGKLVIDTISTGAGHGMLVAGTRSGKTTSAVTGLLHWPGSAVTLDPSAEMGDMLREALEANGKRVFLLHPERPNSGFNALDWIDPLQPLAGMAVKEVVRWVFPENSKDVKTDGYFEPTGRALCLAILADLIWSDRPASEKTLKTFRSLVVTPEIKMPKLLESIHAHSNSRMARDVAGTLMRITPKQWSGVYGQATQGTEWLSEPELADLVSGNSFRTVDILDGRTFVFAQVPLHALEQSPGVGRVIIGALMHAIYAAAARGEVSERVLVELDEAWVLGPMNIQKSTLVAGAKSGIVLNFLYQSVGQIKEIWGENGSITLYNNLEWRAYAATKDRQTSEDISSELGEISVLARSEGHNSGRQRSGGLRWGSRSFGDNTSVQEIKRRLVLPQEIRNAPRDEMFVIAGDMNMRLRMPRYFNRPDLVRIVKPSHYYRRAAE